VINWKKTGSRFWAGVVILCCVAFVALFALIFIQMGETSRNNVSCQAQCEKAGFPDGGTSITPLTSFTATGCRCVKGYQDIPYDENAPRPALITGAMPSGGGSK